jgi:hypothetical protein
VISVDRDLNTAATTEGLTVGGPVCPLERSRDSGLRRVLGSQGFDAKEELFPMDE